MTIGMQLKKQAKLLQTAHDTQWSTRADLGGGMRRALQGWQITRDGMSKKAGKRHNFDDEERRRWSENDN